MTVTKKNNIELISDFLSIESDKNLIINQVSDEIGSFYSSVISNIAKDKNLRLVRENDDRINIEANDLFGEKIVRILNLSSQKKIESVCNENFPKIIISDYKNYKFFLKKYKTINGYEFDNDIRYYLSKYFNINQNNLIDYCILFPHFMNSEITKYVINPDKYTTDNKIYEVENFILEIRKQIFKLKNSKLKVKDLYFMLKKESRYKKFNFLTY